jgi:hypothetical protein
MIKAPLLDNSLNLRNIPHTQMNFNIFGQNYEEKLLFARSPTASLVNSTDWALRQTAQFVVFPT